MNLKIYFIDAQQRKKIIKKIIESESKNNAIKKRISKLINK